MSLVSFYFHLCFCFALKKDAHKVKGPIIDPNVVNITAKNNAPNLLIDNSRRNWRKNNVSYSLIHIIVLIREHEESQITTRRKTTKPYWLVQKIKLSQKEQQQ